MMETMKLFFDGITSVFYLLFEVMFVQEMERTIRRKRTRRTNTRRTENGTAKGPGKRALRGGKMGAVIHLFGAG